LKALRCLLLACTAFAAADLAAPETGTGSPPAPAQLADLEARALQHNPAMASAEAALRAVEGQLRQGGLDAAATAALTQTRLTLLADRERMLNKFRTLFHHTLNDQRRVEARQRLAALAREAVSVTRQLVNVGAADLPDQTAIENEAKLLESSLSAAQFELDELRTVLESTVADPGLELGPLEGDLFADLPKIDRAEWHARLLRESPALKAVEAEIAQDEAKVRAGGAPHELATAQVELARARLRAEQIRITLEVGFAETYADYESAVEQLATYRGGVLDSAERAYEQQLAKYRQMTAAYPQVLIARRTLFQMEDSYVDALEQAWATAIEIQTLLPYELPANYAPPITGPSMPAPPAPPAVKPPV